MAAAYPNRTSPVLRGAFILEHHHGHAAGRAAAEVPALKENETNAQNFTTVRERMSAHSTNPTCFSCHGIMDPLGFALENFDAVGTWRDVDRFARRAARHVGQLAGRHGDRTVPTTCARRCSSTRTNSCRRSPSGCSPTRSAAR